MSSPITLFLKEWPAARDKAIKKAVEAIEANNKAIREFTNQLEGLQAWSHPKGTNSWMFEFNNTQNLEKALPKIKERLNISQYNTKADYLKEVSDAIEIRDHFKAFTLCVALYDSFGKTILISQFKELSLSPDRIKDLEVTPIIIMLYTHGLIREGVFSQMIDVKNTRNDFIHRYLSSQISDEVENKIKETTPKIMRSLVALKKVYDDKLPKE